MIGPGGGIHAADHGHHERARQLAFIDSACRVSAADQETENVIAQIMTRYPDVVRQLLSRHAEAPDGQCRTCGDRRWPRRPWPCACSRIAQRAAWLLEVEQRERRHPSTA